jgi:hypothetical protein
MVKQKYVVRNVVEAVYVNNPFVRHVKIKTTDTRDIVLDVTSIYFQMNLSHKIIKQKNMLF